MPLSFCSTTCLRVVTSPTWFLSSHLLSQWKALEVHAQIWYYQNKLNKSFVRLPSVLSCTISIEIWFDFFSSSTKLFFFFSVFLSFSIFMLRSQLNLSLNDFLLLFLFFSLSFLDFFNVRLLVIGKRMEELCKWIKWWCKKD